MVVSHQPVCSHVFHNFTHGITTQARTQAARRCSKDLVHQSQTSPRVMHYNTGKMPSRSCSRSARAAKQLLVYDLQVDLQLALLPATNMWASSPRMKFAATSRRIERNQVSLQERTTISNFCASGRSITNLNTNHSNLHSNRHSGCLRLAPAPR